jgi:hypothetical protein
MKAHQFVVVFIAKKNVSPQSINTKKAFEKSSISKKKIRETKLTVISGKI